MVKAGGRPKNTRVYQLARKLKISTAELVARLGKCGIPVRSHLSTLDEEEARRALAAGARPGGTAHPPSPAVGKRTPGRAGRSRARAEERAAPPLPRMGKVELGETLLRCQQKARGTFAVADRMFQEVGKALTTFDEALDQAARRYAQIRGDRYADLKKTLASFVMEKRERIRSRFRDLREAQKRRRGELDDFTIMFFGKTMAGKSTTIEALTAGDGSTIGAGDPDFTKDIRGKTWDGLTLIDTPGLLGFREELQGIAEAYVGRADLICMVVTDDSIEPQVFQRMREVRGQNKHLVVLLNVKAANNPILRHEPEDAFDGREIRELTAFIRQRLADTFPGEPAIVIPYCANAAFEAQRAEHADERLYLWKESRIEAIIDYFARTIGQQGVPIRATAAFDALVHYVQTLAEELGRDLPALTAQRDELQKKKAEALRVFVRVKRDSASELGQLKTHFNEVHEKLDALAWEFARGERSESVTDAYNSACDWGKVDGICKQFRCGVVDRLQRNVAQFRDTLGEDLTSAVALSEAGSGDEIDVKRIDLDSGRWKRRAGRAVRTFGPPIATYAGTECGMVVGTLIAGPLGGLVGGLVGGLIAAWGTKKLGDKLVDSGNADQRHAQGDLRDSLRDHLRSKQNQLHRDLSSWMNGLVESAQDDLAHMLDEYAFAVGMLARETEALAASLHEARHKLSRFSFEALLREVHPAFRDGRAVLIDASQWMQYRAKILIRARDGRPVAGLVIGHGGEGIRTVRNHIGSPVDVVEFFGSGVTPRTVVDALLPARLPLNAVEFKDSAVRVTVPDYEHARAQGPGRRNLMLAEEIIGKSIQLHGPKDAGGTR